MNAKFSSQSGNRVGFDSGGCLLRLLAGLLAAVLLAVLIVWSGSLLQKLVRKPLPVLPPSLDFVSAADLCRIPIAHQFAHPLGSPRGALSYNAQPFRENNHLGDDWNGVGGWNSDLGDPVHAIATGMVIFAADLGGGWGGVVLVQHRLPCAEKRYPQFLQSLYGHLDTISVTPGDIIPIGHVLGTVGNAGGRYWAHLHLEARTFTTRHIGVGYRVDTSGWLDPTALINSHTTPAYLLPIETKAR